MRQGRAGMVSPPGRMIPVSMNPVQDSWGPLILLSGTSPEAPWCGEVLAVGGNWAGTQPRCMELPKAACYVRGSAPRPGVPNAASSFPQERSSCKNQAGGCFWGFAPSPPQRIEGPQPPHPEPAPLCLGSLPLCYSRYVQRACRCFGAPAVTPSSSPIPSESPTSLRQEMACSLHCGCPAIGTGPLCTWHRGGVDTGVTGVSRPWGMPRWVHDLGLADRSSGPSLAPGLRGDCASRHFSRRGSNRAGPWL